MFGLFKKKNPQLLGTYDEKPVDMNKVKTWYEGEVVCGDYDINDVECYPYHNLYPHGKGHIIYSLDGKVIEEYKGEFKGAQYHGYGLLVDKDREVFEGRFWENCFVGED